MSSLNSFLYLFLFTSQTITSLIWCYLLYGLLFSSTISLPLLSLYFLFYRFLLFSILFAGSSTVSSLLSFLPYFSSSVSFPCVFFFSDLVLFLSSLSSCVLLLSSLVLFFSLLLYYLLIYFPCSFYKF